ncbi:TPA: hypothetical protein N2R15_004449 [Citrobacter amalonaticus]|uniref:hypothetical protein n=1 Tax=Citrobacter TaxID=544 RepID=UPI0015C117F9|nr:hypothetical protein [Citrobacter sp. Ct235]EKZ2525195.1 hypothetical protein [Citrobacter farmeri]MDM2735966.1 hypothetical protein [Citrobacter sp. Ct235]HCL6629673.1 hypothetical protein [Citrobacter amalonaticus]
MMPLPFWRSVACITVIAVGLTLVVTTVSFMAWELSVTLFSWSTAAASKIVAASLLNELLAWIHQAPRIMIVSACR